MMRYMPAHWHTSDSFELYYVFSGECPIHFPGETVVCHPGSVLIAAPGALHATPCYGDDRVLMTSLVRASTFERVFWNQLNSQNLMSVFFRQALHQGGSAAYLWFDAPRDRELEDLLTCMEQELSQELPYSSQMVNTLMSAFFLLLLRRYERTAQLPRTGRSTLETEIFLPLPVHSGPRRHDFPPRDCRPLPLQRTADQPYCENVYRHELRPSDHKASHGKGCPAVKAEQPYHG